MGIVDKVHRLWTGRAAQISRAAERELDFDQSPYADITDARLRHFESLSLDIVGKSVLDLGCGIGRFSEFFEKYGCDMVCVDGRAENIQQLKQLYPERKAAVIDLETDEILQLGSFDIIFCYGILYHLSDPFGLLKRAFKICRGVLVVETCIVDSHEPIVRLVQEDKKSESQALHGVGSRPSPPYLELCLRLSGFKHIYKPVRLPDHPEFQYARTNDGSYLKNGVNIRDIFIASHSRITNGQIRELT